LKKYSIIKEIYGFKENSWEAQTTPKSEAFVQYSDSYKAKECIRDESALA